MDAKFDIKLYNEEFYLWHQRYVHESSMACIQWYEKKYPFESMVDFGAGIGSYLQPFCYRELNGYSPIKIQGYEISTAAQKYTFAGLAPYMEYLDCTEPIDSGKYDVVISFETAEHIEPSGTTQFILNLVNATGKTLLFTAAPPEQEGTGHINCQTREFWLEEIGKYLTFNQALSKEISEAWEKLGAPWYIVKNLLVFNR